MPLANPAGDWVACRAAVGEVEAWEGEAVAMLNSESIDLHDRRLFVVVGHGSAREGKSARASDGAPRLRQWGPGHVQRVDVAPHAWRGPAAGGSLDTVLAMRVVCAVTRVWREVCEGWAVGGGVGGPRTWRKHKKSD